MEKLTVALIQAPPVFMNLAASVDRACRLLEDCASAGVRLAVFPETWLPGYPVWLDEAPAAALWDHPPAKALFRCLVDNSPTLDGPEIGRLRRVAAETGVDMVLGIHEREGNTLYNSMVFVTDEGRELAVHRKLVPTYTERLVWGRGDGSTLPVVDRSWGRIGGLICWEHWMPLARAAMHARRETVHVAQWPWVREIHLVASRHYAFEGRCFVLVSGSMLTLGDVLTGIEDMKDSYPGAIDLIDSIDGGHERVLLDAGSTVVGPNGALLLEPRRGSAETVYAEIDSNAVLEESMTLDTDGHYSRPDIFTLTVDETPRSNVRFTGAEKRDPA